MHVLILQSGKHKGKRLKLPEQETIIGRDEEAAIRVASSEVSRQHCVLKPQSGGILVRDLGSRNGTFINGTSIQVETLLKPGDLLMVGPMGFLLQERSSGAKGNRKIARPSRNDIDEALSDDDIASWLSDDPDADELNRPDTTGDTTIISNRPAPTSQSPIQPPKKKQFDSVAEEAADIIRRHKESIEEVE